MQILLQLMIFQQFHHSQTVYLNLVVQRNELKVFRIFGDVSERTLKGINIMCSDRGIFPGPTKSVMKFLLSCDKCFISFIVETDIPEDCSCHERTNLFYLNIVSITEGSTVIEVVGAVRVTLGHLACSRQILNALTRVASVSKSGRLFMQSNLKYYLTTFPSLSLSSSSSISIPNSKPRLSSHQKVYLYPISSQNLSLQILMLGMLMANLKYERNCYQIKLKSAFTKASPMKPTNLIITPNFLLNQLLRFYINLVMQGSLLANDLRKVISIVDLLRDIGLGDLLSLPKVVVLGNQSSGKSSLLEQIVGLDFLPRGSGVVTRRPLELRMNHVVNLNAPYAEFDEVVEKGVKKRFTNFNEVRQTIDAVTDQVCGKSKQIIDKPILLNVYSKSCPTLTIIDLPGITSIPVGQQPSNIYDITKNMALRYISEKRSIILCVIPANQDLATSEALKIMREIDPSGQRSIGCLTKIDIMNRGDDARKMLKNEQIPLRYGYVGIKNRCQQDVVNNIPVEDSLKAQKKFFTTSPIYSTLPSDLFGTDSLTKKLTNILYHQIKASMPEIFEEIKKKKKSAQEQLEKLGPGVANTDAEMVNYAWKSVATFLRVFKNSLNGIKSSEYSNDPISSSIREELAILYKDQYDEPATEDITDKDIQKAMINFPGDSTIPGFPSIDAFLSLLNPLLKRLQNPAYEANNKVHQLLQNEALDIISTVMSAKYPQFNSRFKDLIKKILDKYRRSLESYMNSLLDSELFYLFTNDINYLVGDFHKVAAETKEKVPKNPLVYQLRKRIDAYYKLVVRNLRDLIPKQIFNFLLIKCIKELQFEAFQFTSDVNKLKQWLNEPSQVRIRRTECIKAIKVFQESQKKIRMDPDISKLVRRTQKEAKYYEKFGMKSPDQMREEEEKRQSEFFQLTAKSQIQTQKTTPKVQEKKPEPPKASTQPIQQPTPQKVVQPVVNPLPITNNGQKKQIPSSQGISPNQTPRQPQTNSNKNDQFANFFGTGNTVQTKPSVQPPISPPNTNNPPPKQQPLAANQGPTKTDFTNFFGTSPSQPVSKPQNPPPQPPPQPPQPQPEQKKQETKKRTFNKLFGIG